jgi:PhnB protein
LFGRAQAFFFTFIMERTTMAVKAIPDGYHTVTPYLICKGADQVIEFAKRAFGAEDRGRMKSEDGTIAHAEVQIGDSRIMISDANDRWGAMPCTIHLYVEDCDAAYARALEAGGTSVQEVADQFYGDRSGGVRDVAGNLWWISTHVEEVSPEEMAKRAAAAQAGTPG